MTLVIRVDLPTDGNPTRATEASDFLTSKPLAGPAAFADAAAFSSLSFNCAIFAFSLPMWAFVALFSEFYLFIVRAWICSLIVPHQTLYSLRTDSYS